MNYRKINSYIGIAILIISSAVYLKTMQPTVSYWDCGEFIACGYTLSVPHPPGAPLWSLLGKIATMVPIGDNPAVRMNALSAISSGITVWILYLVIVMVIKNWRGDVKNNWDAVIVYGSAIIGALSYAFSDAFWFNATESEVYSLGTTLVALCVWLLMYWWENAHKPSSDRILLFFSFLIGLALGIHLIVVQVILVGGFIYYFRKYEYTRKTFFIAFLISCGLFILVYPVITLWYPSWLAGNVKALNITGSTFIEWVALLAIPGLAYGAYWAYKNNKQTLSTGFSAIFLVIVGYSIYMGVLLRANVDNLPINENTPKNLNTLVSYLSREQYGDAPHWPRRHSQEPMHRRTYTNYTSDLDFLWKFQINHMFTRYLGWQYIGRAGYVQDQGIDWSKFWGIPFLLGLFGLFYHFRKDWKMGLIFLWAFLLTGIISALYQRQQDPQPRERDYFYTGAFFVFSLWIGLGTVGILELVKDSVKNNSLVRNLSIVILLILFVLIPANMFRVNYKYQDRSKNYMPFDYAYNLLQSVDKDAILFTNGDNDTFPLWYLQAVEGIRTDVRVVNLSLLNTDWYIKEMKNSAPYGSLKVPFTLSDAQIEKVQPTQWDDYKIVSVKVPPEAYPDSLRSKGNTPDKLTWKMPATMNYQNIKAVMVKDLMMLEIIKSNNWKRPVCYSITVTDDNYLGLDEYLINEGFAKRLVPYKENTTQSTRYDVERTWKQYMTTAAGFSKTPQLGYSFRGMNDPTIVFNDQSFANAIQNYRAQYAEFAYVLYNDSDYTRTGQVLSRMEELFPASVTPFDYRILSQVAQLYLRIGNKTKFDEHSKDIETQALDALKRNPGDTRSYYNPYTILMNLYESRGEWNSAKNILLQLERIEPGNPDVKAKIEYYNNKLQGK